MVLVLLILFLRSFKKGVLSKSPLVNRSSIRASSNKSSKDPKPVVTRGARGTALTALGVYDRIGKYAGAGSAIPVTGFANSVAAPAIEFQREGAVMGVGARLFTLAGPVLAYGIVASVIVGVVYWLIRGWVL